MNERTWFMMALLTSMLFVGAMFGKAIARKVPQMMSAPTTGTITQSQSTS